MLSTDAEKPYDKTQYPFMIKAYSKLGTEGNFFNLIKDNYPKNATGNILNGEKLDTFLLRQGNSEGCPLSPLLLNILMEGLPSEIKERKVHRSRRSKYNFC